MNASPIVPCFHRNQFRYLSVPVYDDVDEDISRFFPDATRFIARVSHPASIAQEATVGCISQQGFHSATCSPTYNAMSDLCGMTLRLAFYLFLCDILRMAMPISVTMISEGACMMCRDEGREQCWCIVMRGRAALLRW